MIRIFMIGYSENKGGVETYIKNLDKNMDHNKFEVIYSMPEMVIDGKKWVRPSNRHNYLKYRIFWEKFYKENHFDVLYLNTCDVVSIDDLKFAKAAGIPVRIIHSHSVGNQQNVQKKMSLFHKFSESRNRKTLHQFATHLFACSKTAGDWMFDGREYEIIPNGIDLKKYRYCETARKKCRIKLGLNDEFIIGYIGRLTPTKNPLHMINLAEAIIKQKPNSKIIIIGDGELRKDIEQLVKIKRLESSVILIGAIDNVCEWLSALDCLVMPSLFEGLPFVLIEAQASGLHCVVSLGVSNEANVSGLIDYVSLEKSYELWANKVLEIYQKSRKDVTSELIKAGYSIENTSQKVFKIIEDDLRKS